MNPFCCLHSVALLCILCVSAVHTPAAEPWTLATTNGRQHLVAPDGKPFLPLGLNHLAVALTAGDDGKKLTADVRAARLAQMERDLRDWHFNTLGDDAPLVWLWQPRCWNRAEVRRAEFHGTTMHYATVKSGETGDVLVIPKAATDLKASREEFLRVMTSPGLFPR
jgi:hypothetical protein